MTAPVRVPSTGGCGSGGTAVSKASAAAARAWSVLREQQSFSFALTSEIATGRMNALIVRTEGIPMPSRYLARVAAAAAFGLVARTYPTADHYRKEVT